MKIYTKTGDKGETSLLNGGRVSKSNDRISAYGSTDELNSFIGLLASDNIKTGHKTDLYEIQNKLFHIGSMLAIKGDHNLKIPEITIEDINLIEEKIDILDKKLPQLKEFIIPGGSRETAHCHVCRSICRRAEREVVKLAGYEPVNKLVIQYLNRLSDYFFVLSRSLSHESGIEEKAYKY